MPAPYSIQFNDEEGLLLAVALEQFADQSKEVLDVADLRADVSADLAAQVAMAEALLRRINTARA